MARLSFTSMDFFVTPYWMINDPVHLFKGIKQKNTGCCDRMWRKRGSKMVYLSIMYLKFTSSFFRGAFPTIFGAIGGVLVHVNGFFVTPY